MSTPFALDVLEPQVPQRYENPKARTTRRTAWVEPRGWELIPEYTRDLCFDDEQPHNVITSHAVDSELHRPCLDLDGPVRIVSSTTPGHFHLFLDRDVDWDDYVAFLDAAAKIGLVEKGWVDAAKREGCTCVFRQDF